LERDDDAVNLVRVFLEERGAMLRLGVGFYRAVLRILGPRTITFAPAASSTAMISSWPVLAR